MNKVSRLLIFTILFSLLGCGEMAIPAVPANNPTGKPSKSDLVITNVSVRATQRNTSTAGSGHSMPSTDEPITAISGAYLRIENRSSQEDYLLSVNANAAGQAEIHQTIIENDVARMKPMPEGVLVQANGILEFKPGSYHIMLLNLKHELEPGQTIQLTLNFKMRGEISFATPVT